MMDKDSRKKDLFANAMSNLMRDKLGMSIDLLDEILRADPDDKPALLARGSLYLKMGNAKSAKTDFSRVLEIYGNHPKAHYLRGLAREMEGDDSEALSDFNQAIDIDPEYAAAYYSRATLLTKMGREAEASGDMKTVAQLTNANIESFANENNIWRSNHLRIDSILENEMQR